MKDMWVGFMVVMMTTFVGFGLVCDQIADIREELGRIDGMLSGYRETLGEDGGTSGSHGARPQSPTLR